MLVEIMEEKVADQEEWKQIPFAVDYAVSNLGRIKRISQRPKCLCWCKNEILKQNFSSHYPTITLKINGKWKTTGVHRCVSAAFIGLQNKGIQVNHKDGNKLNNNISNLEYVTAAQNRHYEVLMDRVFYKGEKVNTAKLTRENIFNIRKRILMGEQLKEIANKYSVTKSTIWRIKKNKNWKWLI